MKRLLSTAYDRDRLTPVQRFFLVLALWLCCVSQVTAAPIEWGGSFKSLNLYGEEAPKDLFPDYQVSSNRLRLEANWPVREDMDVETALDYQLIGSNPAGLFRPNPVNVNRHIDLEKEWQHSTTWSGLLQVDRLNMEHSGQWLDATIGRQAIGFGRILIVSPLDVIAPFPPDALDTDIRPGVDALQLTGHYGLDGQVGGTFVWGDIDRHNSYLLTWVDNRKGIDLLAMAGSLRDRTMAGLGLAGSLGPLGLKAEITSYEGERVDEPDGDLHDSFAIGAVEAWYRFDNGLSLVIEYLYNGPGVGNPEAYLEALASAPLQEGLTYLLGRHYLFVAPAYQLHPLVDLQGLIIWNLEDDSVLARPTMVCNLADNISLELFWSFNQGRAPKPVTAAGPYLPKSEFGWRGDSGGLFLKLFF